MEGYRMRFLTPPYGKKDVTLGLISLIRGKILHFSTTYVLREGLFPFVPIPGPIKDDEGHRIVVTWR